MTVLLFLAALLSADDFVQGTPEPVSTGYGFTEGPVWIAGKGLLFSDLVAGAIYAADKSEFRKPSGKSNGLVLDRQGRLIACEGANGRVTRTEPDGAATVLADNFLGRKFNSPNDVVVRSDGTVIFTDPPYGLEGREPELPFSGVYAIAPDGKVSLLISHFRHPNGLAFSPDEKTLYIGDSGDGFIAAFDVRPDGTLFNARTIAAVEVPDGMKVDEQGRLWSSSKEGVCVFSPKGELLKTIVFPEQPSNCVFGDQDGKTLYVTAQKGVYKIRCAIRGALCATP